MRKIMTREFCIHDTDIANRDCRKPQRPEDGQPEHWTTKRRQVYDSVKYSLQGTTQGRYLTGGVPPVRFSM